MSNSTREGYGPAYRAARRQLLASNPPCHWCGKPGADTADHEPPLEAAGRPHLNLVPACKACNYGRRGSTRRTVYPPPSREW